MSMAESFYIAVYARTLAAIIGSVNAALGYRIDSMILMIVTVFITMGLSCVERFLCWIHRHQRNNECKRVYNELEKRRISNLLRNQQRGLRRNLLCQRLLWLPAVAEVERA